MEKLYRLVLATLCLSLLSIACNGQSHPSEPNAVYVDDYTESVPITADVDVQYIVILWLLPNGNYDAQVSVGSLSFSGSNCSPITTTSLYAIMETISDDAVAVALSHGYPSCGMSAWSKPFRVWVEECGIRSGTGCSTSFSPASGTGWGYRSYGLTCPGTGSPATVTQGGTTGDLCTGSESALYP